MPTTSQLCSRRTYGTADGSGVTDAGAPRGDGASWPLERVLFALAGSMTLVSATLAAVVSPWFLLLTAFVGVNQWLYVLVGACPASIVLRRTWGLRSAMYGNSARATASREAVTR